LQAVSCADAYEVLISCQGQSETGRACVRHLVMRLDGCSTIEAYGRRAQGALPAFLSPAAVTAAYSIGTAPTATTPAGAGPLPAFLSAAAVTAAYANGTATAAPDPDAVEKKD